MKRSQRCPKCQGQRLWVVERFRVPGEVAPGTPLPVATYVEKGGLFTIAGAQPKGRIDLWVCDACGYAELWAAELAGLREDPVAGVRLLDATPDPAGPFR